jgi:glycosyltransferase involved in cell wall biosynthesis
MTEPAPITLCVSTRNEEDAIGQLIESCASVVSEVVVVDMESEDRTVEIARGLGARIVEVPKAGFAEPGRQQGIDAATQPWVLVLDADELPGPRMLELVREHVEGTRSDGLRFPRQNFIFGRWIRHSGCWPDYQLRLFRRDVANWPPFVHTQVTVEGRIEDAPASEKYALRHSSCPTVRDYISLINHYTDFEVDRYLAIGRRASLARLFAMPPGRFVQIYFFERGFLDGRDGLAIAFLTAMYAVMVELKMLERRRGSASAGAGS